MLLNLVRLVLDTSIILSLCTMFQGSFDTLEFAGRSKVAKKLADRHALVRMGKEKVKNNFFLYHPNCYELSLLLSQSSTFFLYFVGVDGIILQLTPIIVQIINSYYIVKSVHKSNEFRKTNNIRLISFCTVTFVTKQLYVVLNLSLTILYFVGIAPLIWSDLRGLFMDKILSHIKALFFIFCIIHVAVRQMLITIHNLWSR